MLNVGLIPNIKYSFQGEPEKNLASVQTKTKTRRVGLEIKQKKGEKWDALNPGVLNKSRQVQCIQTLGKRQRTTSALFLERQLSSLTSMGSAR